LKSRSKITKRLFNPRKPFVSVLDISTNIAMMLNKHDTDAIFFGRKKQREDDYKAVRKIAVET